MKKLSRTFCALLLAAALSGCGQPASHTSDFFAMDTLMSLTVWGDSEAQSQAAVSEAERRINSLSNALSRQVSASSIANSTLQTAKLSRSTRMHMRRFRMP